MRKLGIQCFWLFAFGSFGLFLMGNRKANGTEKWTLFKNNEQVEYCLSLPLEGYKEDFKKNDVRGKHVFINYRKKSAISLQGFFRSESKSTAQYYADYYAGAEEEGKMLEKQQLDSINNRFYAWGYWSNDYYKTRFLEINWLRNGELLRLSARFPVSDTALWKTRVDKIFNQATLCKTIR